MDARDRPLDPNRDAVVVNRNLAIEVSLDEILDDLLYPARRVRAAKLAKRNGRAR